MKPEPSSPPPAAPERWAAEARRLHRILFGRDVPAALEHDYAVVMEGAPLAAWPRFELDRLVERGVDLEALELALRRRARSNALTQRFQVMCYLAEAQAENYDRFVTDRRRFLAGWSILAFHAVRSLYKLVKGRLLMRIHGLG